MINKNWHTSEIAWYKKEKKHSGIIRWPLRFLIQYFLNQTTRNDSHGSIMIVSTGNYVEETRVYNTCTSGSSIKYAFGRPVLLSDYCFGCLCVKAAKNEQIMIHLCRPSLPPRNGFVTPDGVTNHRLGTTVLREYNFHPTKRSLVHNKIWMHLCLNPASGKGVAFG